MKRQHIFFIALILICTHYIHYKLNQIRKPFYNTVFSVADLPVKFYKINNGDSRSYVDSLLGKPLSDYNNEIFNYSERGNCFFFNNICTYFQIFYENDTVVDKRVVIDD